MSSRNLLSEEWCNLIFEHRNKDYGAYQIRKNMGRRYAVALLVVVLCVMSLVAVTVGFRLLVGRQLRHSLEALENQLPQMKRAQVEKGHEAKEIAGTRVRPRMAVVEEGTSAVPELVEVTKNNIRIGVEKDNQMPVEDWELSEFQESLEELDSLYEERKDSLPYGGPALEPTEVVEEMPQFPGGIKALMGWLDQHVVYPRRCISQKIGGELQVNFLVDVDGTPREPRIVYSLHPDLDRAVLNAIRRMPRWQPGKANGRVTVVSVTLPVNFQPR